MMLLHLECVGLLGRFSSVRGFPTIAFLHFESVELTIGTVYVVGNFSSLVLVTVTVTRKMLTMVLSVLWFGHTLTPMQYLGVGLVFGGIGGEAYVGKREKDKKAKAKAQKSS
jgi:drug/metabolite transporter (DMT)-like permease